MTRAAVIGAGGFVGAALTRGFAALGWRVIEVDHAFDGDAATGAAARLTGPVSGELLAEVGSVDVLVHAAWVTTAPEALGISAADYVRINLEPLLAVLDHVAASGPDAFVFLSSSGVFAPDDAIGGLADTVTPTGTSPYAVAKRAAELLVPATVPHGTAAHVVRLGYLFGPHERPRYSRQRTSPIAEWLRAAGVGGPLEVLADDPARDWTYLPDLAPALERVVAAGPANRPIHLSSGHVHRDRSLAEGIAARWPGTEIRTVPATETTKPPMVSSDLPALRDFEWTATWAGLSTMLAAEIGA